MLIKIFKSNQKPISILAVFLSILLWIPSFWVSQHELMLVSSWSFIISNKGLIFLISALIIGGQSIYLNYIVNEFKLLTTQTHLPALFFVLLNAGAYFLLTYTPLLIVNTLLLIVVHQLFLIYNKNNAFTLSFNIGFIISTAALIYFPIVVVLLLLWFTLLYTKPLNWREVIISVLGFLVPIVFFVSYYYLTNQLANFVLIDWNSYRIFNADIFIGKVSLGFLAVLSFVAVLNMIKTLSGHVVKVKKYIVVVTVMFLVLLLTLFFNSADYLATYLLTTIPLTIVVANYFNEIKRKWLAELLLFLLIGAIIIGYFS